MKLRALLSTDAAAFHALRLMALQESPSAFGSSFEEEKDRTLAQVQCHLTGSEQRVFFGAWQDDATLVGIVGVGREQAVKERHIAHVRSMFVAPAARSQGVGGKLLHAAMWQAAAWAGVEQLTLSVTASNEAAVRLYRSAGFVEVGRMPRALKLGDHYHDELMMLRILGGN